MAEELLMWITRKLETLSKKYPTISIALANDTSIKSYVVTVDDEQVFNANVEFNTDWMEIQNLFLSNFPNTSIVLAPTSFAIAKLEPFMTWPKTQDNVHN